MLRKILFDDGQKESSALVMNEVEMQENIICQIHSAYVSGHVFSSVECEYRQEMRAAESEIQKAEKRVIICLEQKGRGNRHLALMASIARKSWYESV